MHESSRLLLERGDPRKRDQWDARLRRDQEIAAAHQSTELREMTERVLGRSIAQGAQGFALTGSTARAKRTRISDLDYHVVGDRPDVYDLPADIDVYRSSPNSMSAKLLAGDDFVQWTLCCGCILHDAGAFREAASLVVNRDLWPDGDAKLRRLPELRRLAKRLIDVGDRDAAQDHVRATLTSAARGVLLRNGVLALARSELPGQLRGFGLHALAGGLEATIFDTPSLSALTSMIDVVAELEPVSV